MRFASLDALALRGRQVLARFPFILGAGALAAALAIVASTRGASDDWARGAMVAALGLPLSTAIALLAAVRRWPRGRTAVVMLAAGLGLAAFYAAWPGVHEKHHAIRYFQLSAGLHLAVAFLPFVGRAEDPAFWQYNRRLFLSFLRAVVFSGVLFAGLAIALAALDKLFGLDVEPEAYVRLWLVIAFVVNTWIFLSGVPDDVPALAGDREYPRALKIFTQYILTPLVAVYLLILLAYLVKILATGQWPSGWIGYLVTSVAVAGILGFLLVHPLRDDPGEGWIRTYRRWLFIGLVPAALMLLVAFAKRIAPYGLTELRYLGLILGIWLLAIAVLFTLRREQGIRIVPLSLSAVLLITLFGPLGATERAVASQGARLAGRIAAAKAAPSPGVAGPDEREASGALHFLVERRAEPEITAAFGGSMPGGVALPDTTRFRTDSLARAIMTAAALDYADQRSLREEQTGHFSYRSEDRTAIAIEGYRWLVPLSMGDSAAIAGVDTLKMAFDSSAQRLVVTGRRRSAMTFDFGATLARLAASPNDSRRPEEMRIAAIEGGGAGMLLVTRINGRREDARARIASWHGLLMVK